MQRKGNALIAGAPAQQLAPAGQQLDLSQSGCISCCSFAWLKTVALRLRVPTAALAAVSSYLHAALPFWKPEFSHVCGCHMPVRPLLTGIREWSESSWRTRVSSTFQVAPDLCASAVSVGLAAADLCCFGAPLITAHSECVLYAVCKRLPASSRDRIAIPFAGMLQQCARTDARVGVRFQDQGSDCVRCLWTYSHMAWQVIGCASWSAEHGHCKQSCNICICAVCRHVGYKACTHVCQWWHLSLHHRPALHTR